MPIGDEFFLTLLNAKPNIDYFKNYEITHDDWNSVHAQIKEMKKSQHDIYTKMDESKSKKEINKLENDVNTIQEQIDEIGKHPKMYEELTPTDILTAHKYNSFFWRKFPKTIDLETYYGSDGRIIIKINLISIMSSNLPPFDKNNKKMFFFIIWLMGWLHKFFHELLLRVIYPYFT